MRGEGGTLSNRNLLTDEGGPVPGGTNANPDVNQQPAVKRDHARRNAADIFRRPPRDILSRDMGR